MTDIFDQHILNRIETAIQKKEGPKRKLIYSKLQSLNGKIIEVEDAKKSIKSRNSFEAYKKALKESIEAAIEQIFAPGVDEFINWLNSITDNKNEKNTEALRKFLVEKYSESNISDSIEAVLANKEAFSINVSIFNRLVKSGKKELKKKINSFLDTPKEYVNNIDSFLEDLKLILEGMIDIEELHFSKKEDLFSKEQIDNKINWYNEIIEKIIDLNQNLRPSSDSENNMSVVGLIQVRINDIKKCIYILNETGKAKLSDENLKNIFHKYVLENIKYDGGIVKNLNDLIDDKWINLEDNYQKVFVFFDKNITVEYKSNWDVFEDSDNIKKILLINNEILKVNPIEYFIASTSLLSIQQTLTKKSNEISKIEDELIAIKNNILLWQQKMIDQYTDNIPLLESLVKTNKELDSVVKELKEYINALEISKKTLEGEENLLNYLDDDFESDIATVNDISNSFNNVLKQSGKNDHIEWLKNKLGSSKIGGLFADDFNNSVIIKDLVNDGLIKITIEKQF